VIFAIVFEDFNLVTTQDFVQPPKINLKEK